MIFRYQYTGEKRDGYFNKPIYTTTFLDKKGVWRSVHKELADNKYTYPIAEQMADRYLLSDDEDLYGYYNYYEYEIDLDIFYRKPTETKLLYNYWLFKKMNSKYRELRFTIRTDKRLDMSMRKEYSKLDWYGMDEPHDFKVELAMFFPFLTEQLPKKMFDIMETFVFILENIDYQKLLRQYHKNLIGL